MSYGGQRLREQRRGRLLRWLVSLAVIATIGVTVYWYFNPQQRPGWVAERLPTAPTATTKLYRWKDANGQWVVTDEPPASGEYEVVEYRHDANALPYDPKNEDD